MARPRRKSEQQASVTVADIEADLNTGDIVLLPGTDLRSLNQCSTSVCFPVYSSAPRPVATCLMNCSPH